MNWKQAFFKASELQAWLLYYSIPCLIDILLDRYLDHFACLVEGVYILLGDNVTSTLLALARDMLSNFYRITKLYMVTLIAVSMYTMLGHI